MKTHKIILFLFSFIAFGFGIVVSICHMFLFGVNKSNVTLLFLFSAMLFLCVAVFKRDLNASKVVNMKKSIQSKIGNEPSKSSSGRAKETYLHSGSNYDGKSVNRSEPYSKELNPTKDELIQNMLPEGTDIEEKPAIDDEQYKNFAESAAQRVVKETEIPYMAIKLEDETASIFDSKAGGLPYLSKNFDVPLDSNGNQMKLLAQIDCCDLKGLRDYPQEGILQFWMTTKWAWEEAKVIYHKEVDRTITEDEVIRKIHEFKEGDKHSFPVNGSYRMQFTLSSESISRCDYRLKALFCQYFTEISGEYISDPEDAESEEVYKVFVDECDERDGAFGHSHKVGGYRYSTQFGSSDYDGYKEGEKIEIHSDDADVLLFQLCSDFAFINFETHTHDWIKVMWCDDGVGRFSIKRSDLKKCDFNKVWFSWDCY